jgi:preprotein translocase subunit SecB
MELAPIQLTDYFVPAIHVEASPDYNSDQPSDLDIDSLEVKQSCTCPDKNAPHRFVIQMSLRQELVQGKNIPYRYEIHLVGFVETHPKFPEDKLQRAVEVNGPSMLFGAAREILRAATGRGPYGHVLIPSTTFFKPEKPSKPPKAATKKPARKAANRSAK